MAIELLKAKREELRQKARFYNRTGGTLTGLLV